jgi:predicted transposase YbfD/YdcC
MQKQVSQMLAAFFTRWESQRRCGDEPSRLLLQEGRKDKAHIAIDGKTIRATTSTEEKVHLLSFYEVQTGLVLTQCQVGEKQNEISALKPLLTPPLVTGRILTVDAMHTQRFFCQKIRELQGDYIVIVKDNQPGVRVDLEDFFEDPQADRRTWQSYEQVEKGHGRLERRHIRTTPDMNDWFAQEWCDVAQVFRLERYVRKLKTGEEHHEVIYGLSSLSQQRTPAEQVTNMTMLEPCGLTSVAFQNSVIETNGKEHILTSLDFLVESCVYFSLDPHATYGVFGEDEQEFVLKVNGLFETTQDRCTRAKIMRSKPARYIFFTQVGIESFGNYFVLVRIAYE